MISSTCIRKRQCGLAAIVFALLALTVGPALATTGTGATGRPLPCPGTATALKAHLTNRFETQLPTGEFQSAFGTSALDRIPLNATLARAVYTVDHDAAFLRVSAKATQRYIDNLFAHHDEDGDYLIEGVSWRRPYMSATGIEDVGFNAALAIDALSLAAINLELIEPLQALYWWEGSRTVVNQLVTAMYANGSGFFFPTNNALNRRENLYLSLSTLPALFEDDLGRNIVNSVIRNHVLKEEQFSPESPSDEINWQRNKSTDADRVMTFALLVEMLARAGFESEAARLRSSMPDIPLPHAANQNDVLLSFFGCMTKHDGAPLIPRHIELLLLSAIADHHSGLPEKDKALLRAETRIVYEYLNGVSSRHVGEISAAVRGCYVGVSKMRAEWKAKSLFSLRDQTELAGFNLDRTFDLLLQRIVGTLAIAETYVSRQNLEGTGLRIGALLKTQSVVPGDMVKIQLSLLSVKSPITIKSLALETGGRLDSLVTRATVLQPGAAPNTYRFTVRPPDTGASVRVTRFAAHVELSDGQRFRYNFGRGVYMAQPLTFDLSFPEGRAMDGATIPIRLGLHKQIKPPLTVAARWFSPAGLKLREGNSFEMILAAGTGTTPVDMNVVVPNPSRPGSFPFLLKVFANGDDRGVIRADMFKHYQWVFAGPFPPQDNAMYSAYPPERGVDLQASYGGRVRPVKWNLLPSSAYDDDGTLDLRMLLPMESVGYLYTVISAPVAKRTTLKFRSSAPAVVFLNEQRVAEFASETPSPQSVGVVINEGLNVVLIKLMSSRTKDVFFEIGDREDMSLDAMNNNLADLIAGYNDLYQRSLAVDVQRDDVNQIVTLSYEDASANAVAAIGTFNGWSPVDAEMKKTSDGRWEISLHLPPGRYAYRFLVDNSTQVLDPGASAREPDGYGGENSVLVVQ